MARNRTAAEVSQACGAAAAKLGRQLAEAERKMIRTHARWLKLRKLHAGAVGRAAAAAAALTDSWRHAPPPSAEATAGQGVADQGVAGVRT